MYVHRDLVALAEDKKYLWKKKLFPGGGAPLEGGARWLGHHSFYGSLVPDVVNEMSLLMWSGVPLALDKLWN